MLRYLPSLVFATSALAADNRPASSLTADEMRAAYNIAVHCISQHLKAPLTAHYTPIDQTLFSTGRGNTVDVRMNVDAQNSFGALIRAPWWARVSAEKPGGVYSYKCFSFDALPVPKDVIVGPRLDSPLTPASVAPPNSTGTTRLMTVKVESSPSDALIELDGYMAGRTPTEVKVVTGEYTLKISKNGYQPYSKKIAVGPGNPQSLAIALAAVDTAASPVLTAPTNTPETPNVAPPLPRYVAPGQQKGGLVITGSEVPDSGKKPEERKKQ